MRTLASLSLTLLVALTMSACTDGSALRGVPRPAATGPTTPELETPDPPTGEPVSATTRFEPAEAPPVLPRLASGVTRDTTVTFDAAYLEDRWLFGIGADPSGLLAGLGGTGIGIAPTEARLVMEEGHLVARAWNARMGTVESGDSAILMSFPATLVDGEVVVDLKAPAVDLTIEVFNGCAYEASGYELAGAPVFADGLFTWPVDESFARVGSCPGWLPRSAEGLDVPYLRHQSAAGAFAPRAVDPSVPFGFFMTGGRAADELLDRLGAVDDGGPDGRQVYYLSTNFPEVYAGAAAAAFDAWNDVLEPITGVRPFRVERATAEMIPWDPRYHFVIWDTTQSGGAMAPFGEDPATGEIVQNLIIMWFGDIDNLVDSYASFYDKHPAVGAHVLPPAPPTPEFKGRDRLFDQAGTKAAALAQREAGARGALRVRAFVKRPLNGEVVRRTWQQVGIDASHEDIARSIVSDFLVHEIGHHLGLRHNFKGSIDDAHMGPGDTSSSTMDYVIGMVGPGNYDVDAMRYAYGDGPERIDALFCTDEDTDLDPGCAPWDFGHPVPYWLSVLDSLEASHPPEAPTTELSGAARGEDWGAIFTRLRDLLNSEYEAWDPAAVASVFDDLVERVACAAPCARHSYLRGQYALYLMYTRHQVQTYQGSAWRDFPALDETQAATLMAAFYDLVTDPEQASAVKTTIIGKLPTANVPGATELLEQLQAHFAGLASPTPADAALLSAINSAIGG